jgi:NADH:ubiquinone oxidoreductase subunit 5 (subunit L)/multisubunit Na+/H+ antiporter MnhA subunit
MSPLVLPLLLLPVSAAVAGVTRDPARGARRGAVLALTAWVAAVAAVAASPSGRLFDTLVLTLVVGTGGTVLAHAARALRHEPYQRRFAVVGPLLLAAVAVTTLAEPLEVVLAGWLLTSALTVALVRTGPAAADPGRSVRLARAFLVGDAALAAAVVLTLTGRGPVVLAAVLVVVAAATRGAAGPFLRWLPDTLAAPTPASAVLHAGVVASGVLVLLRHGSTVAASPDAALALALAAVVLGGVTCIVAEAVMTTRPDVKGQLAWSTVAQLGFTLVLVGLGFHVAAGLHVIAHGMYKSASFLGAGSAVRALERRRAAPPAGAPARLAQLAVAAVALLTTAGVVVLAGTAWSVELSLTLGLGLLAVWCAAGAAVRRAASPRHLLTIGAASAASAAAYAAVTVALKTLVQPQLAVADPALHWAAILPVLVGLGAVAVTPGRAFPGLWARAGVLGGPTPPPSWRRGVAEPARPTTAATVAVPVTRPATTSGA